MTDADQQGLFRRLTRAATSRAPLAPAPSRPASREEPLLRGDWLRVDAIVEPVWVPEELEPEA